jgi:SAM-dependent methyltransferase
MERLSDKIPRRESIRDGAFAQNLEELGLSRSNIKGKTILDIGSAFGDFARDAKQKNIPVNITSIDRNDFGESYDTETPFVVADTQKLPFEDNSFDYILSTAAMPHSAHAGLVEIGGKNPSMHDYPFLLEEQKAEYKTKVTLLTRKATQECLRTLKPGGELRFSIGINKTVNHPLHELDEVVELGIEEACANNAIIEHMPKTGEWRLYIIKKNPQNEEQKLESEAN